MECFKVPSLKEYFLSPFLKYKLRVSLLINNSLWSFWYNKERDRVLTRRIDAEKKRIEAKNNKNKQNDEKIVV